MKVIVNVGGRWKNDEGVHRLFRKYEDRVIRTMTRLSAELNFKPPKQIMLRPLYYKNDLPSAYGRAIFDPFKGYTIAIAPDLCMEMHDKGLWIIDHECVHIANGIKHKDWGHGEMFHKTYAMCRRTDK